MSKLVEDATLLKLAQEAGTFALAQTILTMAEQHQKTGVQLFDIYWKESKTKLSYPAYVLLSTRWDQIIRWAKEMTKKSSE